MNTERLLILADFLETVPPYLFDMDRFGRFKNEKRDCGSTACALGWATTIPSFNKEGFVAIGMILSPYWERRYSAMPYYHDREGFAAAEKFFDLDYRTTQELFGGSGTNYYTPNHVAKRIRDVVKEEMDEH